ncbi:ABC transporter permease [Catenulispora sp. NL8]|uniref:ABC transporter permease n=1 Tax=Catenulispora pinistramenti TaxID=2705254 RepID=A0ABS5L695_9ACTN|nr:ABC transporter permease [Catenulispora pinistramenti]MBS2553861.1 ABC transporter permease [Catenulispora pinistramenti]
MFKTALANLRAHKARMLLSSITVLLGVGFVAGTLIFTASIKESFFDSFARQAKNVDAAVTPAGGLRVSSIENQQDKKTVDPAALDAVRDLPDVASAEGRVLGPAPVLDKTGKVVKENGNTGVGVAFPTDAKLGYFDFSSGRAPAAAGEIAMDKATAEDRHFALGDAVTVIDHGDQPESFHLVGIFDTSTDKTYAGETVVGFTTPTALRVTGSAGYDQIAVRAKSGVGQDQLVTELKDLPVLDGSGDTFYTGAQLTTELASQATGYTSGFGTFLLVFAIIAALVSALVIQNTFQILVAQRARELALLRCVGATRRQVFGSTLIEAFVFGTLASAAGFFAGIGLSMGLSALLNAAGLNMPTDHLVIDPSAALYSIGLGLLLTVGSAVLPARAATRVAPVQALSAQLGETRVTRRAGRVRVGVGLLLALAGIAVGYAGMQTQDRSRGFMVLTLGAMVTFIGVLALGPVIASPVIRVLGWLPGKAFGPTARLATANAGRNPRRVAATTAALTIGITLVTMFTVVTASIKASATDSIKQHFPFDYQVVSEPDRSVPGDAVAKLRALPELGTVAAEYDGKITVNGGSERAGAIDAVGYHTLINPIMKQGSISDVVPGTVALQDSRLTSLHTAIGQTVTVTGPNGGPALTLKVVASYQDSGIGMPETTISVADFQHLDPAQGPDTVSVLAKSGVTLAASRAAIEAAVAGDPLLTVNSVADYKNQLNTSLNQILAMFTAMLGLAILIALIGIANTLSLSVLERTRESALLRALGLTRAQLRRMLMVEAMLMAVLGVSLGIVMGGGFGWALVHLVAKATGVGSLAIPYTQLLIYVLAGALAGVLAAVVPARRAARQTVATAITEA